MRRVPRGAALVRPSSRHRSGDQGANTASTTVVAAILALARALNIQVIAEGIETRIQHAALMAMSCEMGQGYLLGHPAPIAHWLEPRAIGA